MSSHDGWVVRGEVLGPREAAPDGTPPPPFDHLLHQLGLKWEWREAPLAVAAEGERFAGSLLHLADAFDFTVTLNLRLWPQRARVGIGKGALARARKQKLPFALELGDGFSPASIHLMEQAARLHAAQMGRWKPSRWAAVRAIRKAPRQRDAAALLQVRQQSVSTALRAALAKEMSGLEQAIRQQLVALVPAEAKP